MVNTLPSGFTSTVSVVGAAAIGFTALNGPVKALIGTFKTLALTIKLFTGIAGGPVILALTGLTLAVTGIVGHYGKLREEQNKLNKLLDEGSVEAKKNAIATNERTIALLEEQKASARSDTFLNQRIAKLKKQNEQLEIIKF